jgi:chromosome partitioning protein
MKKVIAIVNQKGGVGKSTTAINLGASLAVAEMKTLVIDLDPQGNASSGLGIISRNIEHGLYEVIIGKLPLSSIICRTELEYLYLAPGNSDLIGAEIELIDLPKREFRLKSALSTIIYDYDFILIDSPPSLGILTLNALCAAQSIIVPLQCEYYAMEGLSRLLYTIKQVQRHLNPQLTLGGVLLTMFDTRNNLSHQVAKEIREYFKDSVFATVIPRNIRLAESPSFGKPAILYDVRSKGAEAYLKLAREVLLLSKTNATCSIQLTKKSKINNKIIRSI